MHIPETIVQFDIAGVPRYHIVVSVQFLGTFLCNNLPINSYISSQGSWYSWESLMLICRDSILPGKTGAISSPRTT